MSADEIEFLCYDNRSCRYEDLIEELKRTVEAQARQLQEAHTAIDDAVKHHGGGTKLLCSWLAANAPTPQPQADADVVRDAEMP